MRKTRLPLSRVFYSMVKRGFMTREIASKMNKTMREIAVTGRFIATAVAHIIAMNLPLKFGMEAFPPHTLFPIMAIYIKFSS